MKNIKSAAKRFFIGLLLVLLGLEAVMETRYRCDELSVVSTDTEGILRRISEVVITEEDKSLMAELLELPSVQELVSGGEGGDISASDHPEVLAAAEGYLSEEEAGSLNVSALFFEDGYVVFAGWRKKESIFYLQFTPEDTGGAYYKCYSSKRGTSYENWDNERARKNQLHRRWFAWLRDGMWKDG